MNNNVREIVAKTPNVSMATPPTVLMDLAFKLGIGKPGNDKEKLVNRVNKKLEQERKYI